ncbi:threonine aldolase family protein [Actinacidiphila guanduensis]|uniref:L-threonine aldolase n=1 Tax=Actinacidiphila guanduensis TaxID=310781 RepID=A0A1H0SAG1_9ACTN|nr:beta-eliminating lyase-related protein [Actinacidiphila guanduensis]SDP38156.1 L-threonine aldolase [Actinacidiphila guanduensis]
MTRDDSDDEVKAAKARRTAAVRACGRVLTGAPGPTLGGLVEQLARDAADAGVDLEGRPDTYGDGVVEELETRVAGLLGTAGAAFFPTGTMAQQVSLRIWAARTGSDTVALHPMAHPEVHERGALSVLGGLRTVHPVKAPRQPTAGDVRDVAEPFGTLMLELPLRDAGFLLPSWEELREVVAAARERDAVVHFDGARLWECTPHFGRALSEIADLADSVYVSFYKSLNGISGAALAGPADFVVEAKAWRHRYGGMLYRQFPTVLAALAGLNRELPRLPSYVAHAKTVARALREGLAEAGVPLARVHPQEPHTHQFQLWLAVAAKDLDAAALEQAEQTGTSLFGAASFWEPGLPGLSMTEITVAGPALEWTEADIRAAAADFAGRLAL